MLALKKNIACRVDLDMQLSCSEDDQEDKITCYVSFYVYGHTMGIIFALLFRFPIVKAELSH